MTFGGQANMWSGEKLKPEYDWGVFVFSFFFPYLFQLGDFWSHTSMQKIGSHMGMLDLNFLDLWKILFDWHPNTNVVFGKLYT